MRKEKGSVFVNGTVAYVTQQGWLANQTLKNNILFGKEFDKKRYLRVLQMCELTKVHSFPIFFYKFASLLHFD